MLRRVGHARIARAVLLVSAWGSDWGSEGRCEVRGGGVAPVPRRWLQTSMLAYRSHALRHALVNG